jgi:hypothetical protein
MLGGINYMHPSIIVGDTRVSEDVKIMHNEYLPPRYTITYETDKPKIIILWNNLEGNPYHLFYYMLAIFYYFDDGKSDIIFYYPNETNNYLCETALSLLPARFKRRKEKEEAYEYVRMPGIGWRSDSIDDTCVYSYIRDLYKDIWMNTKQEKGKRIYISRGQNCAGGRAVLNEGDVKKMLKDVGISCYNLADMTFIDSMKLFKSAEFVTGAHGAGLAWITFCDPSAVVCEVYKDKILKNHYYHLCKELGIEYWRFANVISDPATENPDPLVVDDGNFSICISEYKGALQHLIQKIERKNI